MRTSYLRVRLLLSNISDKMVFRDRKEKENRLKKHCNKTADLFGGSSKQTPINDDKVIQCYAPIVGCVCKGKPLPKSTADGGIKMRCTNEKCEYARQLLHSECFEMLENHLIKVISNIGSARGWTELQRRHNLWEKKGLTLVQKLLRCKCDRGQMVRDTDFYKEEKDIKAVAKTEELIANGKIKKKKKKELPRLNFGYNNSSTPVGPLCDTFDFYTPGTNGIAKKKSSLYDSSPLTAPSSENDDVPPHANGISFSSSSTAALPTGQGPYTLFGRTDTDFYREEKDIKAAAKTEEVVANGKPNKKKVHKFNSSYSNNLTIVESLCDFYTPSMGERDSAKKKTSLYDSTPPTAPSSENGDMLSQSNSISFSPSSTAAFPTGSAPYTLFGRTASSFFLGERILAELYLPTNGVAFVSGFGEKLQQW